MTFYQLMSYFKSMTKFGIRLNGQYCYGHIVKIEMESGNGHSWNITVCAKGNNYYTGYIRTID